MINRDIYEIDPSRHKLVNEGVANVNDNRTEHEMRVLRYELETFVCDGRYEEGLERILRAYLSNLSQAQQPAVWVSGFFGSGKSHLVKMLRALWENTEFADGKKARDIAQLPTSIQDLLRELSTAGRRSGGLHAASGTLGAGASGSVRLALLRIIFKSVDLPSAYPQARFVMWLHKEGIFDAVRQQVEAQGDTWAEELEHFYVAEGLHRALVTIRPQTFPTLEVCSKLLDSQYPNVTDIGSDDLVRTIQQALRTEDGIIPLTLIVLDEIQQYIGESSERSIDVQEAVEACCKQIGSRLLFIGTGQTAVTGTANLKKLEGRFTVRVELSDTDVDAVIRKVVLAKKASARRTIDETLQHNNGEISRHLRETTLAHHPDDQKVLSQDYPILPVRRRFWKNTLQVLDQTGTDSQLRNQLTMVHKAIQTNLEAPVGHVVAADYLYFDAADKLLQAHLLPRKIYERTMTWIKGSAQERLMARATGIVFLLNKVASRNTELGIRANLDTIADLLVEDLNAGSSALRSQLGNLLDHCELLMRVGDEYRIQTEESTAWNDEYQSQRNHYGNQNLELESERNQRIKQKFAELVPNKQLTLAHGASKVPRQLLVAFDSQLGKEHVGWVVIWVRDGWSIDEQNVRAEAFQAGHDAPTIFVFIPKRASDDLRSQLISYKAATATLNRRGVPNTPEGTEARSAIVTIQNNALGRINELLAEAFSAAKVFKGGGDEVLAAGLPSAIQEAAESSLLRLYPQFAMADEEGWGIVYNKAAEGAPDALKRGLGYQGEPEKYPVCNQIVRFIGAGKRGEDIRAQFENAPYGWSRDTVDGALLTLVLADTLRATDERGAALDWKRLDRRAISQIHFKTETTTITTPQRLAIRALLQKMGITAKTGEESAAIPDFIQRFEALADRAGGNAPLPVRPDTRPLENVRVRAGNEQLLAFYEMRDALTEAITTWQATAQKIEARWQNWEHLLILLRHAASLPHLDEIQREVDAIVADRLLLDEPDPVQPLGEKLYEHLETALLERQTEYQATYQTLLHALTHDPTWQQLSAETQRRLLEGENLQSISANLDTTNLLALLRALDSNPLPSWADRIGALQGRFERVREQAARILQPQAQALTLPRRTLQSQADLQAWLQEIEALVSEALANGAVILK